MFMNLTIHDTKQFTIHNISSPIHYLYLDSTTRITSVFINMKPEYCGILSIHSTMMRTLQVH